MTLVSRLTTMPRAHSPGRGAEARDLYPELAADLRDLVAGAGGSSPFLAGLLRAERDWLPGALNAPEDAVDHLLAEIAAVDLRNSGSFLRQAKRRIALLVALMDLGGVWRLETVTRTLSGFAARACDLALRAALEPLIARGKLPGQGEDAAADAGGMFVLAMGKMGAEELNYSSDIDLICLFDQDRFAPADFLEARSTFVRATRSMCRTLSDVTGEGYVFRTDLRLRPDPAVTPVCMAVESAERYYEALGRTWERAAYIKARPVAGDIAAGDRFLDTLTPFVWRKHLDFAAIEDAHNIRLAIREHKGRPGPITLPGHDMKLGRGGIREIEFYTQTRQLIAGGRDADLRVRGTVEGLQRLATAGWVPQDTAETLSEHYRFHRTIEHRVQMVQDAQTHILPQTDVEFDRLACLMGQETDDLKAELHTRLSAVHSATEGFFAPSRPAPRSDEATLKLHRETLTRWASYPALRSSRARGLLDRLQPELEARLGLATRPDEALAALDGFLKGLPAGVQLLSLFEANPSLIDLVLDIVSTSPALADHLSHNAQVLDAVIGGGFFEDWPGQSGLEAALRTELDAERDDYEAQLDLARRWMKEWHFRIGVHLLRGLIPADEASAQYADLARAILTCLWPEVQRDFARRHGSAPGRGGVLLGMGSLGAGQLTTNSDLDLIVIYDADGAEGSDGPRPLATRPYFARLTQALITALQAQMPQGRLYEVDMRLRPSGNQGPVATSWPSFRNYQCEQAWTWEHLALTRAQVIAGPADLAADVEAFRCEILRRPRDPATTAHAVSEMRARITAAKPSDGWLDIKAGSGRIQDIELLAQTGALLFGLPNSSLAEALSILQQRGILDDASRLTEIHALFRKVLVAVRLLGPSLVDPAGLGTRGRNFLLRMTEQDRLEDLQTLLEQDQVWAAEQIAQALARIETGEAADG